MYILTIYINFNIINNISPNSKNNFYIGTYICVFIYGTYINNDKSQ